MEATGTQNRGFKILSCLNGSGWEVPWLLSWDFWRGRCCEQSSSIQGAGPWEEHSPDSLPWAPCEEEAPALVLVRSGQEFL